jgi:DNA-binding MarR family transcriptional regulator
LAYISEYVAANRAGVAPSHADLQRFFNLTPPSVNSMLVRLERCGFIRRVPGKARAIEVLVPAAYLPPLERPFKF